MFVAMADHPLVTSPPLPPPPSNTHTSTPFSHTISLTRSQASCTMDRDSILSTDVLRLLAISIQFMSRINRTYLVQLRHSLY